MKPLIRLLIVPVVLVLMSMAPRSRAQQPPSSPGTFRAVSEMVLVPVIVTKDGKHLGGLKKDDFTLLADGKPQSIAGFQEVVARERKTNFQAPPNGFFTNSVAPDETPPRVIVLLVDLINTSSQKQAHAREGIIRYLEHAQIGPDPVMIVAMRGPGLYVIHNLTTDPDALVATIKKLNVQINEGQTDAGRQIDLDKNAAMNRITPGFEAESTSQFDILNEVDGAMDQRRQTERTGLTLRYLQQLTRYLAGIPGRKTLIWATEGISYVDVAPTTIVGPTGRRGSRIMDATTSEDYAAAAPVADQFERTWNEMAAASIAVYPVDLEEVVNPVFSSARGTTAVPSSITGSTLKAQTMNSFPERTGGKYCELQSHMENCYRAAVEDSAQYYMLAFYPSPDAKSGWHKLQVRVSSPGSQVRARAGYTSYSRTQLQQTSQGEIAQVLNSALDAGAIAVAARWLPAKNTGGKSGFELRIDPDALSFDGAEHNHFRLQMVVAVSNGVNRYSPKLSKTIEASPPADRLAVLRSAGLIYTDQVELPQGTESVRFVVQDELGGRIGSVTASVKSRP